MTHLSSEHEDADIVSHRGSILHLAAITNMQQESSRTPRTNVKQQLKAGAHVKGVTWKQTTSWLSLLAFVQYQNYEQCE